MFEMTMFQGILFSGKEKAFLCRECILTVFDWNKKIF